MNIDAGYITSKTEERLRYEENVHDKAEYQEDMKRMMLAVKNHESFEVDIDDDTEKQYAFTKVLRQIRKQRSSEWKPLVYGYDMNGHGRVFSINKESDLEIMMRCILGEITVEDYFSDTDPGLIGLDYIPVRFEVKFIKMTKNEKTGKTEFVEKVDGEEVAIESVDDFRDAPDGAFFPFINLLEGLDLKIREKHLTFRNSYSIIPAPLEDFDSMFNLKVHKEIIAYKIYTQANIKRQWIPFEEFFAQYVVEKEDRKSISELEQDRKQLIISAKFAKAYNESDSTIEIMRYARFYCIKDCITLMDGMTKFNNDLAEVFSKTEKSWIGIDQFISISAVGYDFARIYGCFDGCYQLSGKPQNFIQRCVSGGRTMTANNEKQYVTDRIQDFDAVSLYPSAMSIMDGVPMGKPKVISDPEQLMSYDTFFIEINITKMSCKSSRPYPEGSNFSYRFGQVFKRNEAGSKIFCNEPVDHFYVDKMTLMDLIEFYDIEYEFIRGYYFDDGFNNKINAFIKTLFDLRLKYKSEKNPLEKTIKLLLNSIYGKSILKPMTDEVKVVDQKKLISYIYRNYNFIKEVTFNDSSKAFVKKIKPINNHFNLPQFGASVLSWSKHIMNQVMSTAEQNNIDIYYQDTDSLHLKECDVPKLAEIYKAKYGRELIGKQMTQFHCDFDSFQGSVGEIHSRKLIALGKKSYLDILVDEAGNEGYHVRMKGVPKQCILNKCKRMGITVEELYERMYNGEAVTFDLTDGCNCFKKTKTFDQISLPQFFRKVQF